MNEPGHYIKKWRQHRMLTQEKLAEKIGITRPYLSKVESGKRRYDQKFLESVSKALKCSVADLLVRDPSDPEHILGVWEELSLFERPDAIEVLKDISRRRAKPQPD